MATATTTSVYSTPATSRQTTSNERYPTQISASIRLQQKTLDVPSLTVLRANAVLLKSGRYSDLTIKCQEREFKVHKAVVCMQSSFFEACVDGGFRESLDGVINLADDDPDTVSRMLSYIYTMNYSDKDPAHTPSSDDGSDDDELDESTVKRSQLRNNVLVYSIADKYGIDGLKNYARNQFERLQSSETLDKSVLLETAALVYDVTRGDDRALRELITARLTRALDILAGDEEFRQLCQSNGELCYDMLLAHKRYSEEQRDVINAANEGYIKAEKLVETVIAERQFCGSVFCQGLRSQLKVRRTGSIHGGNLTLELWCKMCGWSGADPDFSVSFSRTNLHRDAR